jgi:hypothetical protein
VHLREGLHAATVRWRHHDGADVPPRRHTIGAPPPGASASH